jgi:hypothetical protein
MKKKGGIHQAKIWTHFGEFSSTVLVCVAKIIMAHTPTLIIGNLGYTSIIGSIKSVIFWVYLTALGCLSYC